MTSTATTVASARERKIVWQLLMRDLQVPGSVRHCVRRFRAVAPWQSDSMQSGHEPLRRNGDARVDFRDNLWRAAVSAVQR
jgi:hypothetical protein